MFPLKFQTENNDSITFIRTYSPNHNINWKKYCCLEKIKNKEVKSCFQKKKVLLSTRQPPNLSKLLFIVTFERLPIRKQIKPVGFPLCKKKKCWSFLLNYKSELLTWHYRRCFSCDSKDVLYVLICNNCDFFYIGQTEELK